MSLRLTESEGQALLERMAKVRAAGRPTQAIENALDRTEQEPKKADSRATGRPSLLELRLAQQITEAGLPEPVREYFHLSGRDFRLDFSWPALKVGVEVQGAQHRVKGRFKADIEKRALGLLAGWKVLEVSGNEVRSGQAIQWLSMLIQAAKPPQRAANGFPMP